MRAILGDVAETYEKFLLKEQRRSAGIVYDFTTKYCMRLGVDSETANIRRVSLGGDFDGLCLLLAFYSCDNGGLARRVREKS